MELVRTVRFLASHHYRIPEWSDAQNREAFGATADPHRHEYALEVTVGGDPDPRTGFVVDLGALDAVLEEVVGPLRGRSLNETVPVFREGLELSSTENLAAWIWTVIHDRIPGGAELRQVRVFEDDTLGAACRGGPASDTRTD